MQNIPPAWVNSVFEPLNACFLSERAICSINVWLAVKYCFWSLEFKPAGPIKLRFLVYYNRVLVLLNGNMKSSRISSFIGCLEMRLAFESQSCGPSTTVAISKCGVCCRCHTISVGLIGLGALGVRLHTSILASLNKASCVCRFLMLDKGFRDVLSKFHVIVDLKCIFYNFNGPWKILFTVIHWSVSSCSFFFRDPVA